MIEKNKIYHLQDAKIWDGKISKKRTNIIFWSCGDNFVRRSRFFEQLLFVFIKKPLKLKLTRIAVTILENAREIKIIKGRVIEKPWVSLDNKIQNI